MDYLIYILAICISAPMILMTVLADSKTRRLLGFMILGMYIAVLAAEFNSILAYLFSNSMDYFHLTITVILSTSEQTTMKTVTTMPIPSIWASPGRMTKIWLSGISVSMSASQGRPPSSPCRSPSGSMVSSRPWNMSW